MELLIALMIVAAMVFDGCEYAIVGAVAAVALAMVGATAWVTRRP